MNAIIDGKISVDEVMDFLDTAEETVKGDEE